MKRVDLPPKYSGWQVVDATPQETNDGEAEQQERPKPTGSTDYPNRVSLCSRIFPLRSGAGHCHQGR